VGLVTPQNSDAPDGALRQGQGRRHKAPGRGARQFSKLRDCRRVWHLHALARNQSESRMRENRTSGSMSGPEKPSHGRASEALPEETGS